VIEATVDVDVKCFFTSVATGTVATVVSNGDGFGEGHVEPCRSSDTARHLSHFEGVRESSALVVFGKNEDLGLAGEASK
jgi:hypothetical protein